MPLSVCTNPQERTGNPIIDEVIESFLKFATQERYNEHEFALGMCNHASDEFLHELAKFDIDWGEIEHYEPGIKADIREYPYPMRGCAWHWAVRLDEWVLDWTARQFYPNAPFPAVWRGKRREWRNAPYE